MSEPRFDIVFLGQIVDGFDQQAVEAALARLLKLPPEKSNLLFGSRPVTLKKSVDKALASRLYVQLRGIGADIQLRPSAAPPTIASTTADVATTQASTSPRLERDQLEWRDAKSDSSWAGPNPYRLAKAKSHTDSPERSSIKLTALRFGIVCLMICIGAFGASTYWMHWPPKLPIFEVNGTALENGTLLLTTPERIALYDRSGLLETDLAVESFNLRSISGTPALVDETTFVTTGTRVLKLPEGGQQDLAGSFWCHIQTQECELLDALKIFPPALDVVFEPLSEQLFVNHGTYFFAYNRNSGRARSTTSELGQQSFVLSDGLLYSASSEAPALKVFSIDPRSFLKPLDELLFLDPSLSNPLEARLKTFVETPTGWWVVIQHQGKDRLHRFSRLGDHLDSIDLASPIAQLIRWQRSILAIPESGGSYLKFSLEGLEEAPFSAALLLNARDAAEADQQRQEVFLTLTGLTLTLLLLVSFAAYGLYRFQAQLLSSTQQHDHPSLLELPSSVRWHQGRWRADRISLLAAAVLTLNLACIIGLQVSELGFWWSLVLATCAAGITLGVAAALIVPQGFIGIDRSHLVIVDRHGNWDSLPISGVLFVGPYLATRQLVYYSGWHCLQVDVPLVAKWRESVESQPRQSSVARLIALLWVSKHSHSQLASIIAGSASATMLLLFAALLIY